jgi:hypothetical protein
MARKRSPDSTSDRQRIQFAYNADCEMPIGKVFQYLLKNDLMPSREGKHKGLDAMSAFWKPFAYQDGQVSEEERGAIARESIEALTRQIDLIRETFGVEKPESPSNTADLKQEIQTVVTEVVQNLMANGAIPASMTGTVVTQSTQTALPPEGRSSTIASTPTHEGVDFDEDALLGGLFDNSEIAA